MKTNLIDETSLVCAQPEQLASKLGDDVAILNLKSGVYYGLNPVGARIWELIQQPKSVAAIRQVLLGEFDVEPQQLDADLNDLLQQMQAEDLIRLA
jgi:hypothetical protein